MSSSVVFLIGTSREDGNTWKILTLANAIHAAPVISLVDKNISYFDYQHRNIGDDFIPTIEQLLTFDTIVFVSPVYWYTVSAQMKTFMDRMSDLLGPRKDLGRKLRGKKTFLLATGSTEQSLPPSMEETMRLTFDYLGMNYKGAFYASVEKDLEFALPVIDAARSFVDAVFKNEIE